jgi:hypothetical protein
MEKVDSDVIGGIACGCWRRTREETWSTLGSYVALKVINHLVAEVMNIFEEG